MKLRRDILLSLSASLVAAGVLSTTGVLAQNPAPSYIAAPDVYKLLGENDQFRAILATWKPGQRDAWHSHAGPATIYRLSDCKWRIHTPDGKVQDRSGKRGEVSFNPIVPSHSFENVGTTECSSLIVERK